MTDIGSSRKVVRFGEFEADLQAGSLSRRGVKVRVRHQLFTALSMLLERAGEVVTREELQKRLWPGDVFVDFEVDLNTTIARLREALGDSADHPRYIETLPKRGYRFLLTPSEGGPTETPEGERRARIVVLPFANAGGDPSEEYFSDSMTDEIITALCGAAPQQLAVIARTTTMHFKNSKKDVARIGRELGVDYVVEGGVRRSDGHVAMNIQLIQTSDQTHLFAGKYGAEMQDVFSLQTRIAEDIAKHIPSLHGLRFGGRHRKKPTEDVPAYQLYLQGRRHMLVLTPKSLADARRCFGEALARDPQFALAYDGLGESYWWLGFFGFIAPKQASFEGFGAALRAVEIDPSLGETHALLGQFRQKVDYNWPEVRREMMVAMEMDPSSPLVRARYAVSYLMPLGHIQEALEHARRGLEIDPLSWELNLWRATFYWLARDYEHAVPAAQAFVDIDPEAWGPQFIMGSILRDSGNMKEGLVHQRQAVQRSGGSAQMLGFLAYDLARIGETEEARSLLERIRAIAAKMYVSPSSFAWAHLGLGEYDEAIARLGETIDDRDSMIVPIKTYPFLDPLRSDPRFDALIRKMNLEP